jgi:hypothetical protein
MSANATDIWRQKMLADEYFDTPEAAGLMKLSESSLNKLRVTGGGPDYMKLGRRVVYPRRALDAWMNARVRTSTSDPGTGSFGTRAAPDEIIQSPATRSDWASAQRPASARGKSSAI